MNDKPPQEKRRGCLFILGGGFAGAFVGFWIDVIHSVAFAKEDHGPDPGDYLTYPAIVCFCFLAGIVIANGIAKGE